MKTIMIITCMLFLLSCKKECPIPDPDPVDPITYDIKYVVTGQNYWYKYTNPITEQPVFMNDTISGISEHNFNVSDYTYLSIVGFSDTSESISVIIFIDNVECDSDFVPTGQDKAAKGECIK